MSCIVNIIIVMTADCQRDTFHDDDSQMTTIYKYIIQLYALNILQKI